MRSKSDKRLFIWSSRIEKWASERIEEFGPDSKEGQYAYGVSMGILVAKQKMTAPKNMKKRYKPRTLKGYEDAQWLISKALTYGDAPAGKFLDLLEAPRIKPLTGAWSRRDSPD